MRLVLDTSVLVAAFRSGSGASRRILEAALGGRFVLLLSVPLMLEYESVLTRAEHLETSGLSVTEVNSVLDALAAVGEPVRLPFHWRPILRAANDDMVLEAAVNGRADGLVTFNDRDFLPVRAEFNIRIFSPRDLIRKLEKK